MANIEILDGQGATKYVKSSGAGSAGDPFITENTVRGTVTVDGSAVTQPVSGTVTANAGTGTQAVSSVNSGTRTIIEAAGTLTRSAASSTTINANGIIEDTAGTQFITLTGVAANNGDSVLLKRVRMSVAGGSALSAGNFAIAVFDTVPGSAQMEGTPIVFSNTEADNYQQKVNLNTKYTSTATIWNISDDSSSFMCKTASGSTDLNVCILSLNSWAVTGSEAFRLTLDFERLVD